jgi:phosphate:Na+ symporter
LVWFVKPIAKLVEYLVPEVALKTYEIDQPKYLTPEVLKYPETAISALRNESIYLFENPIFEIIAHALSISRTDIMSEEKTKNIIMKSNIQFKADPGKLYLTKVKSIYGKIIEYGTKAQSELKLTQSQHQEISQLKIANRKMVEMIKLVEDLTKNINLYMVSDNTNIKDEYDRLRQKVVKVLRIIYRMRTEKNKEKYHDKLILLKQKAKQNKHLGSVKIDKLIRKDSITADMASSYFNDFDNVNDIVKNLIDVADLLFALRDPLFLNGK